MKAREKMRNPELEHRSNINLIFHDPFFAQVIMRALRKNYFFSSVLREWDHILPYNRDDNTKKTLPYRHDNEAQRMRRNGIEKQGDHRLD